MTLIKTNTAKTVVRLDAEKICMRLHLLLICMFFSVVQAAETPINKVIKLDPIMSIDEIPVEIFIKGYGKIEADVLITDRNRAYIDVNDLFDKLGILCVRSNDTFTGFIENVNRPYVIDFEERQITIDHNTIRSPNGFTKESAAIFVESTVLSDAFGFNMIFNYRSLSIVMDANFELPLVKKARLDKIRQNVSLLQSQNEVKSDSVIGRKWNEPTPCWTYLLNNTVAPTWPSLHPTTSFVKGRGYLYSTQAVNPTKEFAGLLNNGTVTYPLTNSSPDLTVKGFNLIGNPYPSSIDWKATTGWTRSDLITAAGGYDMYIWNPAANNYGVFNSNGTTGTNSVTQYIAPTQGFFVRASTAGSITMGNAVRVNSGANNWMKVKAEKENRLRVKIQANDGTGFDEVLAESIYPVL
ncbi:hypothetical protein [Flavobacterium muglaense]|uniref:Uncharacterized protein n=1 Tax=Flavobacterium muglaense TaxID=2764716 RepID=A0A923N476_9FLAO|nr:hypothetical protein [Flavobacterium muglaense]MBC5839735.1 hypothetical protein [Flavobacterium muglaense]MBC5846259.1 hypothetical protein [Flavobacterium muglaense]